MFSPLHLQWTLSMLLFLSSSAWPAALSLPAVVTNLPGFPGPLPFYLETGYVSVDESDDVQFFYYAVESESKPEEDPLLLWLTGGPGCSSFTGLAFEMGPISFKKDKYNGALPKLMLNPYSWTKFASIIFLDCPVGTGFSFSRTVKDHGIGAGDILSSNQVYKFMRKWLIDHPKFLHSPFYVAGDSYGGKVAPIVAQLISEGIEARHEPLFNLKGYVIGNPITGDKNDGIWRIETAHCWGIISPEFYELIKKQCEGEDFDNPTSAECAMYIKNLKVSLFDVSYSHILETKCDESSKLKEMVGDGRSLEENTREILMAPGAPALGCRAYGYYLAYQWANRDIVRKALHIQKGTTGEWNRCTDNLPYARDIPSTIKYHLNLTTRGYRALVYSGDHDPLIPFLGTAAWIRSLNFSIVDEWRSWWVDGQVAGYTRTYANNLTFATVKGAGHTAVEYNPKECSFMVERWLSQNPL